MTEQSRFITALTQPEAYPRRPERVEVLQTHISMLFFAGDEVFKVKKAVDLGFVDYSTLARRRYFCEEEVRLNRRLAGDIYLGVARIVRANDGSLRVMGGQDENEPEGEVIEYAVHMRRLPADRMLGAMLDRGEIDNRPLGELATLLINFHNRCATGEGIDAHATPEAITTQVRDNLDTLASCAGDVDDVGRMASPGGESPPIVMSRRLHDHIRRWMDRFLEAHRRTFEQRVRDGRIRDGHGDLHAGNVCLLENRIVIYDCIEFTPRFRCRDVACEVSFLAMDLDRRGYRGFSRYLVRAYMDGSGDTQMAELVPFYTLHLACVRAMVAGLRATDEGLDDDARRDAVDEARAYAHLAGSYVTGPILAITCGLPGSGKSTAARAAAMPFEARIIRSDVVRKRLAGIEPTQRVPDDRVADVYSDAMTQRTYETIERDAAEAIRSGRSVIADATFSTKAMRERFAALARTLHAPFAVLWTDVSDEVIEARMQQRRADPNEVSDADLAVHKRATSTFESPRQSDDIAHVVRIGAEMSDHALAERLIDALLPVDADR